MESPEPAQPLSNREAANAEVTAKKRDIFLDFDIIHSLILMMIRLQRASPAACVPAYLSLGDEIYSPAGEEPGRLVHVIVLLREIQA
jgi:hypothetical protein